MALGIAWIIAQCIAATAHMKFDDPLLWPFSTIVNAFIPADWYRIPDTCASASATRERRSPRLKFCWLSTVGVRQQCAHAAWCVARTVAQCSLVGALLTIPCTPCRRTCCSAEQRIDKWSRVRAVITDRRAIAMSSPFDGHPEGR